MLDKLNIDPKGIQHIKKSLKRNLKTYCKNQGVSGNVINCVLRLRLSQGKTFPGNVLEENVF